MAWRRIGVIWNNRNDPARAVPAIRRAYSLRDQMPPLEAAHVTAFYLLVVEDNLPAATTAVERLLASWPDDLTALNNLGVYYGAAGRYGEGAEMYRRALALRPGTGLYLDNLVQNLIILDQFATADSLLDGWLASDTSAAGRVSYHRARLAAERGDYKRAYAIVDSVSKVIPDFRDVATDLYMRQGRFREVASSLDPLTSAVVEGVVRGNPATARRMLDKLQADTRWDSIAPDDPRPYSELAAVFTTTGSMDRAEALLARVARQIPEEVLRRDGMRAYALASITLSRGDGRAALSAFRRAHRLLRCTTCTAFDEGRTFENLGEADSAIVQYERFVNGHNVDPENREFFLAAALRRLGEMYESKGQRAKALEYYGRFVDLWKDADPEFQPLVADIRKHMAELAGEPPRR
jgi:tetratricopeptide (TPR) repeat protein